MPVYFVGYDAATHNAYRVIPTNGRKVLVRADCIFADNYTDRWHPDATWMSDSDVGATDPAASDAEDTSPATASDDGNDGMPSLEPLHSLASERGWAQTPQTPRPQRETRKPTHLEDFAMLSTTGKLPPFKHDGKLPADPRGLKAAITSPEAPYWIEAMGVEVVNFEVTETIAYNEPDGSPVSQDGPAERTFWVFRASDPLGDGYVKFRARLVADGSDQNPDTYDATAAPTVSTDTLFTVLHIAANEDFELMGFDIGNAYLHAKLDKPMYIRIPLAVGSTKTVRVLLKTGLYGLKNAGEMFNRLFNESLEALGLKRSISDPCLYLLREGAQFTMLLIHVDDALIATNHRPTGVRILEGMRAKFGKVTDYGSVQRFLGMDIERDFATHSITLKQSAYVQRIVDESITKDTKIAATPMQGSINLDSFVDDETPGVDIRSFVGKLRFAADRTRPDIAYMSSRLATFGTNAQSAHVRALERGFAYLKGTINQGLRLGGGGPIKAFAFSDASHKVDGDSRAQLGRCIHLGPRGGAIIARSVKAKTIQHSSCSAELTALIACVKDIEWLRILLEELGFKQTSPTVVFEDNKCVLDIIRGVTLSKASRHLCLGINYLREQMRLGTFVGYFTRTSTQTADGYTKAQADQEMFFLFRDQSNGTISALPSQLFAGDDNYDGLDLDIPIVKKE